MTQLCVVFQARGRCEEAWCHGQYYDGAGNGKESPRVLTHSSAVEDALELNTEGGVDGAVGDNVRLEDSDFFWTFLAEWTRRSVDAESGTMGNCHDPLGRFSPEDGRVSYKKFDGMDGTSQDCWC